MGIKLTKQLARIVNCHCSNATNAWTKTLLNITWPETQSHGTLITWKKVIVYFI